MSHPFFIWTMQRTGGTSLTDLLMDMSEHRRADHEPFNWRKSPRQFASVAQNWAESRDDAQLRQALAGIFSERYLIKHCYELHPELSFRLMEAAANAGYRHILLLRRDEMSRLISKFLAEAHGTWFKDYSSRIYAEILEGKRQLKPLPVNKVVEQYQFCRDLTDEIRKFMRELGVEFREICYEDLYVGEPPARLRHLEQLLDFLDFGPEVIERHRSSIEEKIFKSGQNTASVVQFVPNLQAVISALVAAGCPGPEQPLIPEGRSPTIPSVEREQAPQAFRRANVLAWQPRGRQGLARPDQERRLLAAGAAAQPATADQAPPAAALATGTELAPYGLRAILPEFGSIAGWLNADEAEELFRAAAAARSGSIVEVGSYRGRATQVLCAGSSVGARLPVYALDPHEKSVGAFGTKFGPKDRAAFFRNLFRTELVEHVRLLNTISSVVTPGWKGPVSLLFIAAARRYPSAAADFAAWQPHLVPGATVAFYDSDLGDRKRAVEALVASGTLDVFRRVGNLALFRFTGLPAPQASGAAAAPRDLATPIGRANAAAYQVPWDAIGSHVYYGADGTYLYQPIPGCGCTAIKAVLSELQGLPADDPGALRQGEEHAKFPGTSQLSDEEQLDIYQGRTSTFKFVIVADPYARLARAYQEKISQSQPPFVDRIKQAAAGVGVTLSDAITFEEFVRTVSCQPIEDMDSHWRAQYYEGRFATIRFDFIGRMERMPDDLLYVLERIGAPEAMMAKASGMADAAGAARGIWRSVSPETRKMFLDRFEIDFDVLQYPRRLPHVD